MNKIYANKAAWDAATKSTTQSTIALLSNDNSTVYKGVNVITDNPKVGDMVFYDSDNKVHFIALDTFVSASKPNGWTAIGVVGHREGSKLTIIWKGQSNKKWADVFRWAVTGMLLDGASHNATINIGAQVWGTFSYQASDKQTFATQLDTWVRSNAPSTFQFSAYLQDDRVILQNDNYTKNYSTNISGFTLTAIVGDVLGSSSSAPKWNGINGEGGIVNLGRATAYLSSDLDTGTNNPTTTVVNDTQYPVCKFAYLGTSTKTSDKCAWLRAKYGEGEEGWHNYLQSMCIRYPNPRGIFAPRFQDGKANTDLLSSVQYKKRDGTFATAYPAAAYCASVGVNGVDQLGVGDFHLMSNAEAMTIIPKITYGLSGVTRANADPINRSLNAIGATALSAASHQWLSCRYYAEAAWIYNALYGGMHCSNFYYSLPVAPISLYDLNKR